MRRIALLVVLLSACAQPSRAPTAQTPELTTIPPPPPPENNPPAKPPPRDPTPELPSGDRNATDPPPTHVDENGDRVPVSFVASELLAAVDDAAPSTDATLSILTWMVEVDDRPLVIDRAVVWIHRQPKSGADSWQLANLYRHPLDDTPNNATWHVAMVYDAIYTGQQSYPKAPGQKELDDFFAATWWKFQPSSDFRTLDSGICTKAWTRAIGKAPNHRYP